MARTGGRAAYGARIRVRPQSAFEEFQTLLQAFQIVYQSISGSFGLQRRVPITQSSLAPLYEPASAMTSGQEAGHNPTDAAIARNLTIAFDLAFLAFRLLSVIL